MKKIFVSSVLMMAPISLLASGPRLEWTEGLITSIARLVDLLFPVVIGLALLFFLWGLATFIWAAGDESKHSEGKNKMIWGIIALFVMTSVWGIVFLVGEELGIDTQSGSSGGPIIDGLYGGPGGGGYRPGHEDCPIEIQGTSECDNYLNQRTDAGANSGSYFNSGLTNEGYDADGNACPPALFGTPPCAYDRDGTYQGVWTP